MHPRTTLVTTALAALAALATFPAAATAGCGCDKPPPPVAAVRPAFASPGQSVTLFSSELVAGRAYLVTFANGSETRLTTGLATTKRDFADGVVKPQLVVAAPGLPPGPTKITVWRLATRVLQIPVTEFTMLQQPLPLGEFDGETIAACYRAAVSTEGTVYFPVDITGVSREMIFGGFAQHYPLLFTAGDIAIYNTQGVLMQLLGPAEAGIYSIEDPGSPHSFRLVYDRHEFLTYKQRHLTDPNWAHDPKDPAWHLDGSRHIDHDHLVVAIRGTVEGEGTPTGGETPPFDFRVMTAVAEDGTPPIQRTIPWSLECGVPDLTQEEPTGSTRSDDGNDHDDGADDTSTDSDTSSEPVTEVVNGIAN